MGDKMYNLKKSCDMLELNKVLEMLLEFTSCDGTNDLVLDLFPSCEEHIVKKLVSETDEAFVMICRFGDPEIFNITSPERELKRASSGISMNQREILNIGLIFRQARILRKFYENGQENSKCLKFYFDSLIENIELEKLILKSILSDNNVSDDASYELKRIRSSIRNQQQKIRNILEHLTRGSNQKYLQDNIITMRDGRYVVPVRAEYKSKIPVHDVSASGSTIFIEPSSVVNANNDLRLMLALETEEINKILQTLTEKCLEVSDVIKTNYKNILNLDLIFAKARLAIKMNATFPKIVNNGEIFLNKARHPLIDCKKVVPINIEVGNEFKGLIITGPNTGGKTVALKTIGLLTLMVMCGLLIPVAENSKVSVFDNILVDIGDGQSIESSLSTFSSHMLNIVSILDIVNSSSLVLMDELGAGTDPEEGASLAVAIIEDILNKNACFAATTHYTELKMYALEHDNVENACFEFDIDTLTPTYNLMIGMPGQSNAFEISQKIGLKQNLIDKARGLLSSQKSDFVKIANKLEMLRKEYENNLCIQREEISKIEKIKCELKEKQEEIENKIQNDLDEAQNKARYIVDSVRVESNRILEELKEIKKKKEKENVNDLILKTNSILKHNVDSLYERANPVISRKNENYTLPRNLEIGDDVLIYDINKKGKVLSGVDKNEKVLVGMGLMKVRVSLDNLRLIKKMKNNQKNSQVKKSIISKSKRRIATEIDLRGQNVEEAIASLDRFIDQCVLSNIENITVIHGKGTGILRKAINSHLKKHPSVCEKRLGVFGEGEDGVTIVKLK